MNPTATSDKDLIIKDIESTISVLKEKKNKFEDMLKNDKYEYKIKELENELEKENTKKKELLKRLEGKIRAKQLKGLRFRIGEIK